MSKLLFFAVLLALIVIATAQSKCDDADKTIGKCAVHYHVCGKAHWHWTKVEWKYEADASTQGMSAHSGQFASAAGAAEDATKKLFAQVPPCVKP